MTARPRKSAPKKAAPVEPEDETSPVEAMRAEVDTEQGSEDEEVPAGHTPVTLTTRNGSARIIIPPSNEWSTRATDLLADGRIQRWAEMTFSDKDMDAWDDLDPTNEDASDFIYAWRDASGQDEGKSRRSRRSSRNTRRR